MPLTFGFAQAYRDQQDARSQIANETSLKRVWFFDAVKPAFATLAEGI